MAGMKRTVFAAILFVASRGVAQEAAYTEKDFLSRARRLTVEGRRAGEGYFSPDGKRMVFQSEREPGNPFYQIYELDLTTGSTRRNLSGEREDHLRFFPGTHR